MKNYSNPTSPDTFDKNGVSKTSLVILWAQIPTAAFSPESVCQLYPYNMPLMYVLQ